MKNLADALWNGRLLVIEGAGHFPHLDRPELLAQNVLDVRSGAVEDRNQAETR